MTTPAVIDWRTQPHLIERPAVIPMSWDEYIAWNHEGGLVDWIDGEAHLYVSTSSEHQRIIQFIVHLIEVYVRVTNAGQYRTAPYAMRAAGRPGGRGREPDIILVLTEHLGRMGPKFMEGPADLVVEVISEDDPKRDLREKFAEYEAAGVREYWTIDSRPGSRVAAFHVRDGLTGHFVAAPTPDGVFTSALLPGFWVRLAWLWDESAVPLRCASEMLGRERLLALLD